jgi:hypothetical protein
LGSKPPFVFCIIHGSKYSMQAGQSYESIRETVMTSLKIGAHLNSRYSTIALHTWKMINNFFAFKLQRIEQQFWSFLQ